MLGVPKGALTKNPWVRLFFHRRAGVIFGWLRSMLAPRERFLPGLGARMTTHPRLFSALLVALRRAPAGPLRSMVFQNVSRPLIDRQPVHLAVPVAGKSRMQVDTSDLIGRVLAVSGIWEPRVTAAFEAVLERGDVCVDVGANIGYFTLLASRLVGPGGHVYALEPSPNNHAALVANLQLNQTSNVTALRIAAGDREGSGELHEAHPRNRGASTLRPDFGPSGSEYEPETTRVHLRPLASVMSLAHMPRLRLVKIDVEGYELEVMRGLEPVLERGARASIIVELTPEWSNEDVSAYVEDFCVRYRMRAYELGRERLLSARGIPTSTPTEISSISDEQEEVLLAPEEARFP